MKPSPYLVFNGNCEEAFKFYERVLGGKIDAMMTFGGTPMEKGLPEAWRTKIVHASMQIENRVLMGSDCPPDRYQKPQGFSVCLDGLKDPAEAERVFHALAEKGTVTMPAQQTYWATRFGMLVDQFGTPWIINYQ